MISLCSCVCGEQLDLEKVFSSPFSELAGERCQYRNKVLVAMVCLRRNPPPPHTHPILEPQTMGRWAVQTQASVCVSV